MSAKQPIVLTVNYVSILLPDDTGLQAILRALTKGLVCRDHLYKGELVICKEPSVRVEVATVPRGTTIVHEDVDDAPTVPTKRLVEDRPLLATVANDARRTKH